jgi:hypothetical protein
VRRARPPTHITNSIGFGGEAPLYRPRFAYSTQGSAQHKARNSSPGILTRKRKASHPCPRPLFITGTRSKTSSLIPSSPANSSPVKNPCSPASCSPKAASFPATLTTTSRSPSSPRAPYASTSMTAPPTPCMKARFSSSPVTCSTPPQRCQTASTSTSSPLPARTGSTKTTATSAKSLRDADTRLD